MSEHDGVRNSFYCMAVYDIGEKRVQKVNKVLKEYLYHKQNSVFVGELKKSDYISLKNRLTEIIDDQEDKVCFWMIKTKSMINEIQLGKGDNIENDFY